MELLLICVALGVAIAGITWVIWDWVDSAVFLPRRISKMLRAHGRAKGLGH